MRLCFYRVWRQALFLEYGVRLVVLAYGVRLLFSRMAADLLFSRVWRPVIWFSGMAFFFIIGYRLCHHVLEVDEGHEASLRNAKALSNICSLPALYNFKA